MTVDGIRETAARTWPDGRERRLALGAAFEARLGDPWAPGPFGFPTARARDEDEQEPGEAYRELLATGFVDWTVPLASGGQAVDVDETFLLARLLARRDQTLSVTALATTVGYMPIWAGGSPEQKKEYGARLLAGDRFGFALSERGHGSDILANETRAERDANGDWTVRGAKQGIGNAALARWFTVVARTAERPGPASLSVIVVDREDPAHQDGSAHRDDGGGRAGVRDDRTWRLHGLRGFALGDLTFDSAFAPAGAVVGGPGRGLETILRAAQVARSLITALPLGGADTSLRTAMDFASWHTLFGTPLREVPYTRAQLAECFARLVFHESANTAAIRGLQAFPEQAAILSSAVKYTIPRRLTGVFDVLTDVLGARHFDREHPRVASHAKAIRDSRVAHFADGNADVCLKVVAAALADVLPDDRELLGGSDGVAGAESFAEAAALRNPLPPFEPWRQAVAPRHAGVATSVLPLAALRLDEIRRSGGRLGALAGRVLADLGNVWDTGRSARRRAAELRAAPGSGAAGQLRLAGTACATVIAGCAAAAWLADPESLGDRYATLAVFALGVALEAGTVDTLDEDVHETVFGVLDTFHRDGRLFSTQPVALAAEREAPPWT